MLLVDTIFSWICSLSDAERHFLSQATGCSCLTRINVGFGGNIPKEDCREIGWILTVQCIVLADQSVPFLAI